MYLRPTADDYRIIAYHSGGIMLVFAAAAALPMAVAAILGEWQPLGSFTAMVGVASLLAAGLRTARPGPGAVGWRHGMAIVGVVWLVGPAIGAVPLAMSGHYGSWLDAFFDAMSGLTTTGLSVIQDGDHLAVSLHVWRHVLQFLGGCGVVVAFLSLYGLSGAALFHSEARDDRFLPSARSTARFIWKVSLVYAAVGIGALWATGALFLGFTTWRALFHAFTVFTAAYSTGGFAPVSTSIGYYHSMLFEMITVALMALGATNFAFHYQAWHGRRRTLMRNTEIRVYVTILAVTAGVTLAGLAAAGMYGDLGSLLRQGLYQGVSAQTTTGFSTIPSAELARWLGPSFAGIAVAMALGSMASSTGGGVKALRVALTLKTIVGYIRRSILPRQVVIESTYVHGSQERRLEPSVAQGVLAISLLYFGIYILGAGVGYAYGFSLEQALFESISAAGTVGLSTGITGAGMPVALEAVAIGQMWVGRLEFVAVFTFLGYLATMVAGR